MYLGYPALKDGRLTKILVLIIIDLIAIIGNSIFLFAVYSRRSLRHQSRTYFYFSYVSLTSLVTALFIIPFPIITFAYGRWVMGPGLCYFNGFMTTFCLTSCVYSITVLSLHKYITIVLPMRRRFDQKRTLYHCVISFLLSLVVTVSLFIESRVYFNPSTGLCALYFMEEKKTLYTMLIVSLCYAAPTVINVSIYIQIFRALRQHKRRLQFNSFYNRASLTAQRQTVSTMYMTFGSFLVGWTPFFVYAIMFLAEKVRPQNHLLVVAYFFGFASSAANPLIFISRNMRLRNSWSSILRKKQIPKVKLISTVSRYGFSSSNETLPVGCHTNHLAIADEKKDGTTEAHINGGGFLRTSTSAFDYSSNPNNLNRKTFKTKETAI